MAGSPFHDEERRYPERGDCLADTGVAGLRERKLAYRVGFVGVDAEAGVTSVQHQLSCSKRARRPTMDAMTFDPRQEACGDAVAEDAPNDQAVDPRAVSHCINGFFQGAAVCVVGRS